MLKLINEKFYYAYLPKQLGIEDKLICSIGNLKDFPESILTIFPATKIQCCIVHQFMKSLKYYFYNE